MGQARIWPKGPNEGARELRGFEPGWIPSDGTVTIGNNIDAYLDADGNNIPDATTDADLDDGRASSDTQIFDFAFGDGTTGEDPLDFPAVAISNAFFFTNVAHDFFHDLGFNEAAGNYQVDNFGLGGTGGDPVFIEVHDPISENNATFMRAPEGLPSRLQLGIFTILTGTEDARDSAYDSQVILHEYGHGVTNRLAGGPNNVDCLRGDNGDADLAVVSPNGFLALSLRDGSTETISFRDPEPGLWTVVVSSFATFENVTLEAGFPIPTRIARNGEWTRLAGELSSETFFEVDIPAGADTFKIKTAGGTGDLDLFVAEGAVAVCQSGDNGIPCLADARSIEDNNDEEIDIPDPAVGKWFIDLNAFSAYAGATLTTEVTGDTLLPSIPQGGVALATQTPVIPEISPGAIVTAAGVNFAPPGTFVISPTLDGNSHVTTELAKTCLEISGFLSPMFAATSGQANA